MVDFGETTPGAGDASEATLQTLGTEVTLEAARVLLASLDGKDYATQLTVAAILTELALKASLTDTQPVSLASLPTGAATIADGSDAAEGAIADAAVAAGAAGSVSAKLRRLTTDLDAVLTELKLKADLTETQPVSLASLPTGAVTIADGSGATEGAIADAAVAAGAAGSVSAKLRRLTTDLDAVLTELKLKADLTETQPVSAAALPLPNGASTSGNQTTIITALQLIDDLQKCLNSVATDSLRIKQPTHGDLKADSYKPSPAVADLQAIEAVVNQRVLTSTGAAGTRTLSHVAVPSGKMQIITMVSVVNWGSANSDTYVNRTTNIRVLTDASPVKGIYKDWIGFIYLDEAHQLAASFQGCALNDAIEMVVQGYQIDKY